VASQGLAKNDSSGRIRASEIGKFVLTTPESDTASHLADNAFDAMVREPTVPGRGRGDRILRIEIGCPDRRELQKIVRMRRQNISADVSRERSKSNYRWN